MSFGICGFNSGTINSLVVSGISLRFTRTITDTLVETIAGTFQPFSPPLTLSLPFYFFHNLSAQSSHFRPPNEIDQQRQHGLNRDRLTSSRYLTLHFSALLQGNHSPLLPGRH
jgi:hypothetical protein